jgi:hypothetical protein
MESTEQMERLVTWGTLVCKASVVSLDHLVLRGSREPGVKKGGTEIVDKKESREPVVTLEQLVREDLVVVARLVPKDPKVFKAQRETRAHLVLVRVVPLDPSEPREKQELQAPPDPRVMQAPLDPKVSLETLVHKVPPVRMVPWVVKVSVALKGILVIKDKVATRDLMAPADHVEMSGIVVWLEQLGNLAAKANVVPQATLVGLVQKEPVDPKVKTVLKEFPVLKVVLELWVIVVSLVRLVLVAKTEILDNVELMVMMALMV